LIPGGERDFSFCSLPRPDRDDAQIDHISIDKRHSNIADVRSFRRADDSDTVIAEVTERLSVSKRA